jgi:hypothetical protein
VQSAAGKMLNNKAVELQNQVRQTSQQTFESLKQMKNWEQEMKQKELERAKQQQEQPSEEVQVSLKSIGFF